MFQTFFTKAPYCQKNKYRSYIKNKSQRNRATLTMVCWFTRQFKKENASSILNDPSRIYNLDKTGVQLCPKTGKLLGPKKEKNLYFFLPRQKKVSSLYFVALLLIAVTLHQ